MDMLSGLNHIAVMTTDLDRFVEFYAEVFGLEVVFEETDPAFRHAILRALAAAGPAEFAAIRDRLVARGASDGAVDDLGAFQSVWFTDPDGMQGEVVLIVDAALEGIHAPRRVDAA